MYTSGSENCSAKSYFILVSYEKPRSSYYVMLYIWGSCRGNLKLITLGGERLLTAMHDSWRAHPVSVSYARGQATQPIERDGQLKPFEFRGGIAGWRSSSGREWSWRFSSERRVHVPGTRVEFVAAENFNSGLFASNVGLSRSSVQRPQFFTTVDDRHSGNRGNNHYQVRIVFVQLDAKIMLLISEIILTKITTILYIIKARNNDDKLWCFSKSEPFVKCPQRTYRSHLYTDWSRIISYSLI